MTAHRFVKAANNSRPPLSHRYDVYGPKIMRRLTLYRRSSLTAWIQLESAPSVSWYCERPLVIEDIQPRIIPEFYAVRDGREELYFAHGMAKVRSESDIVQHLPGFALWCTAQGVAVRFLPPPEPQGDSILVSNWAHILRELAAFKRHVPPRLPEHLLSEMVQPISVDALTRLFVKEDPLLVRIACWSLLHGGKAACASVDSAHLSVHSEFQAR